MTAFNVFSAPCCLKVSESTYNFPAFEIETVIFKMTQHSMKFRLSLIFITTCHVVAYGLNRRLIQISLPQLLDFHIELLWLMKLKVTIKRF